MSQQPTFSKTRLIEMNNSELGNNWIKNLANIKDNENACIYATWDATWYGRIYVALPANLKIDAAVREKWNFL